MNKRGKHVHVIAHNREDKKKEETTLATTTFNILAWIRARRLKWVGQILRLKDKDKSLIKETLKVIHGHRQAGDILMDTADDLSWEKLQKMTADEKGTQGGGLPSSKTATPAAQADLERQEAYRFGGRAKG